MCPVLHGDWIVLTCTNLFSHGSDNIVDVVNDGPRFFIVEERFKASLGVSVNRTGGGFAEVVDGRPGSFVPPVVRCVAGTDVAVVVQDGES